MPTCVIFNPTARGDKARHFRRHLDEFAAGVALKPTQAPGHGRRLAAEAVRDGFETVVAAGGDGTVNEVLNGIADTPDGFARARLAVLPLGTVNVFARELGLPLRLAEAWQVILNGRERLIDAPFVEHHVEERPQRRYFARAAATEPAVHLHAVVKGSVFWAQHRAFRDALRRQPRLAMEYAALKRRLAQQFANDREAYTDAKAPFIQAVLARQGGAK